MKRYIKIVGTILCLLLALSFVAGLAFPRLLAFFVAGIPAFVQGDAYLYWGGIGMKAILAGLAFWALLKFRRTSQKPQRVVFLLIVVTIIATFATEIAAWMTPAFGGALRGPVETALAYTLGIALTLGFLIEGRGRRA